MVKVQVALPLYKQDTKEGVNRERRVKNVCNLMGTWMGERGGDFGPAFLLPLKQLKKPTYVASNIFFYTFVRTTQTNIKKDKIHYILDLSRAYM